jgi:transporter family protein
MDLKTFLLTISIALLSGSAAIFEKVSLKEATPMTVFTIRSLFIVVLLLFVSFFSQGWRPLMQVSGKTLFFILLPATLATMFVGLYFSILKNDLASRVVPIIAGAPLVTAILSILFLGEPFSWKRVIGAILVVAGVILVK